MPICKGARLKIYRADKHIADLESCIDRLKERLVVSAHIDTHSRCEYIKCDFAEVSDRDAREELALLIGDAIHNLKCALDHIWFETVSRLIPNGDWGRAKFPAFLTVNHLETALRKLEIDISAPKLFNFLVGDVKPYSGGDFAIWPLHKLDIRDKHRLLIPVIHYSSIGDIEVEDQHGMRYPRGSTWGTTTTLPYFVEWGIHVKHPGSATFDVMFQEGDTGEEARAEDTLHIYSRSILSTVKLFEEFVES